MKSRLISCKRLVLIFLLCAISVAPSFAFDLTEDIDSAEIDVWELTLEENISYPEIPNTVSKQIRPLIKQQYEQLQSFYKQFRKQGFEVRLIRNDELIKITMPADSFFAKNSNNFNIKNGNKYWSAILGYLRITEFYRVIISMHHDNTTNDDAANDLTYKRVLAITDWLSLKTVNARNVIPYSMGNDYPLTKDNSSKSHAKNRRIEVFIFPGKTMIDLAKENKLLR